MNIKINRKTISNIDKINFLNIIIIIMDNINKIVIDYYI